MGLWSESSRPKSWAAFSPADIHQPCSLSQTAEKKLSCAGPLEVSSLPGRYHEAELSSSQVNIVQKATPELRLGTPHLPETWWVVETIIRGTLCWWGRWLRRVLPWDKGTNYGTLQQEER